MRREPFQTALLRTTMLTSLLGAVYLSVGAGRAADMAPLLKAPAYADPPAVDGINGKVDAFGGTMANRSIYGSRGTVSIPLGGQLGAQLDGSVGSFDHSAFGNIGGHLFWRDPRQALLGVYVSHTHWDQFGGVHVSQVAAEGEYYWQRWTLQGVVGVEFGNSVSNDRIMRSLGPGGALGAPPAVATTTSFIEGFDVRTRLFDQINLKYYVTDNWDAYVGHRYLGGKNALALGSEYAMPLGHGVMASGFLEGRVGEAQFHGIWGGLRFYFGGKDKPLMARHRQDDPNNWGVDSLFSIVNSYTTNNSGSSALVCNAGLTYSPLDGECLGGGL